jgi:hypothetical protein
MEIILVPHNIVFSEIGAGLHLDELKVSFLLVVGQSFVPFR